MSVKIKNKKNMLGFWKKVLLISGFATSDTKS